MIDQTHDLGLLSWVPGADRHSAYPIQNLPHCVFTSATRTKRGGVVIGDYVFDLEALLATDCVQAADRAIIASAAGSRLNAFFALTRNERAQVRQILSALLQVGSIAKGCAGLLVPSAECQFHMPADVGDYSDFFAGIHHAKTAGKMFRPDNPLLPNYKHVPIAYHGRASSIRASGHPVVHPIGQRAPHGATSPEYGESKRLDFELEIGIWVSGGNAIGTTIPIADSGSHLAGFCLLNDWSARDIQAWETQPLGPFLGKNFLTTVSPFVVTTEALAPFRKAQPPRPEGDPAALPYLIDEHDQSHGAFDIHLEVHLTTEKMRREGLAPHRVTRASGMDLYWTPAQMVAHHTSNGCDLRAGDLLGTGTVSSPSPDGYGSLLELTSGGRDPVVLESGETRTFLEDGDEITFTGWCERAGFARISFGEARGRVVPNPGARP
jgi:fumarylacetoacetase